MLTVFIYFVVSIIIPGTANLLISVSNIATVVVIFASFLITFFAIVGLKVHADMNSTVVGSIAIGVGYCFKVISISTYNILSNIVIRSKNYFKKYTKSSFISCLLATILLIIII